MAAAAEKQNGNQDVDMTIDPATQSISRRSLHTELGDRLRDMIVEGALVPGSKIPERDLCERFGVSRTPLREALKVLAAEGLVVLAPNRGAWVSEITISELEEVFPVMGALEALSGELACARITDAQLKQIRKIHDRMIKHYEAGQLTEYFEANQMIHETILEAAGNATLSSQYRSLATRIRRARYIANMSDVRWRQAVSEHEDILQALSDRNGKKLAAILKRHLHNKFKTVREWLRAQEDTKS